MIQSTIRCRILSFLFISFALMMFTGCGVNAKNESEIKTDLQNHSDFYSVQDVSIDKLSIIKRQTNQNGKTDYIYVTVLASNDNIECELSYELHYELYNDGWVLDNVFPYNEDSWKISPLVGPEQAIADEAVSSQYSNYSFVRSEPDIENLSYAFYYTATKDYEYMCQEMEIEVSCNFNEKLAQWVCCDTQILDITANWDIAGIWCSDGSYSYSSYWYDKYYISIEDVDNDNSIKHIIVYNNTDGYIYYDDNIALDPTDGAYLEVPVSLSSWDNLDIYIKCDKLFIQGRGTRSGCVYFRSTDYNSLLEGEQVISSAMVTIVYDANGGYGAPESHSVIIRDGAARYTLSDQQPDRDGYSFVGWRLENSSAYDIDSPGQSIAIGASEGCTLVYYAQWN